MSTISWELRCDNAQAESFTNTLKAEEVYLAGYESGPDVAERIPRFIDEIYSTRRLHSALGYASPNNYEERLASQAKLGSIWVNSSSDVTPSPCPRL